MVVQRSKTSHVRVCRELLHRTQGVAKDIYCRHQSCPDIHLHRRVGRAHFRNPYKCISSMVDAVCRVIYYTAHLSFSGYPTDIQICGSGNRLPLCKSGFQHILAFQIRNPVYLSPRQVPRTTYTVRLMLVRFSN